MHVQCTYMYIIMYSTNCTIILCTLTKVQVYLVYVIYMYSVPVCALSLAVYNAFVNVHVHFI